MKLFPKGSLGYAILLIILFSLAAVATKSVVDLAAERVLDYEHYVREISLAIWLLTMGFMFLAGALGLWGISATAEYESRYRIARIVNTMNNLADGLLALDYQGYVKGANPAAHELAARPMPSGKKTLLATAFPDLTANDLGRLLNRNNPAEIEIESFHPRGGLRRLRLRSQPAEGVVLVFISDITEMHSATVQQQQSAKLQLLGRIAGGVAHDFSNILSGISGHAALMQRFSDDKRSLNDSLAIIGSETQRGVRLSRQLLALSRSSVLGEQPSNDIARDISEAEELLRVALSSAWNVAVETTGTFDAVPFSPSQIVQIVLNLGLLAADSLAKSGRLMIRLKQPAGFVPEGPGDAGDSAGRNFDQKHDVHRFAAVIIISASAEETNNNQAAALPVAPSAAMGTVDTTGVIPSVVRSLIEEAGGRLDELYAGTWKVIYRVCLPRLSQPGRFDFVPFRQSLKNGSKPAGAGRNLAQMKIVLATDEHKFKSLEKMLAGQGAVVERKTAIDSVLRAVDSDSKPDLIVAEKNMFGAEADSLLKAVRKICPQCGIIIVSRHPDEEALQQKGFVFLKPDSDEETWLNAIGRARQPLNA